MEIKCGSAPSTDTKFPLFGLFLYFFWHLYISSAICGVWIVHGLLHAVHNLLIKGHFGSVLFTNSQQWHLYHQIIHIFCLWSDFILCFTTIAGKVVGITSILMPGSNACEIFKNGARNDVSFWINQMIPMFICIVVDVVWILLYFFYIKHSANLFFTVYQNWPEYQWTIQLETVLGQHANPADETWPTAQSQHHSARLPRLLSCLIQFPRRYARLARENGACCF